ncbi:MAG TPA: hypothetical protein VHZ55_31455 [Bryobacteraceae bacterium]|nr:hypothetical protein [Bryobacteraceae bacterium]
MQPRIPIACKTACEATTNTGEAPRQYHGKRPPFTPAEAARYNLRCMSKRVNACLKDEFGGRLIRVRGAHKIMAHLMFGILALTIDQLLKLTD